nr:hypothetical protein GCM10020092_071890 [Actinoplanes digitatis]
MEAEYGAPSTTPCLPSRRGDVDDPAVAAVPHAAGVEHRAGHPEHAVEVGLDDVVPQFVGDVGGDAAPAAARVVDQDVDGAEAVDRGLDERLYRVLRPDVDDGAVDLEALLLQLLDGGGDVVGAARADEHPVILRGQQPGGGEADPAGGTGDDGDASRFLRHGVPLLRRRRRAGR